METTGGRSKNDAPHKYYNQWADSIISYGLNIDDIGQIYSDDVPLVVRKVLGGNKNLYASMYWLDWYGAAGAVLSPPFYPQMRTAMGYEARPQYFQQYVVASGFGNLYYYKYMESTPIAVSSGAGVLAVPYQGGEAPELYTDLLDILSSLNINSQWVIPVKLEGGSSIEKFGTVLVESINYLKNKDVLDSYASGGGHLVVIGGGGEERELDVRISDLGMSFEVKGVTLAIVINPNRVLEHNQVNWTFPLEEPVAVEANGVIHFSLWCDGNQSGYVGVTLQKKGIDGYYGYDLPDEAWIGWKDFTLPLSYFEWMGTEHHEEFDSIAICLNQDAPYSPADDDRSFRVNYISVIAIEGVSDYQPLQGVWENASTFKMALGGSRSVLWKESYLPSWQVSDDEGRPLDYYFAGPGMIYLDVPEGVDYVVFHMPISTPRMAGIIISGLSLVGLATAAIVCKTRRKTSLGNPI